MIILLSVMILLNSTTLFSMEESATKDTHHHHHHQEIALYKATVAAATALRAYDIAAKEGNVSPEICVSRHATYADLKHLLKSNVDTNRTIYHTKPLLIAVSLYISRTDVVQLLLDHSASPFSYSDNFTHTITIDNKEHTITQFPLHTAVEKANCSLIKLLLDHRANANQRDYALDEALDTIQNESAHKRNEIRALLCTFGAIPNKKRYQAILMDYVSLPNRVLSGEGSPLSIQEAIDLVIEYGADFNGLGDQKLVRYIQTKDFFGVKKVTIEEMDAPEHTPLTAAIYHQKGVDVVEHLLNRNADPCINNLHGKNAFDYAQQSDQSDYLKLLITHTSKPHNI